MTDRLLNNCLLCDGSTELFFQHKERKFFLCKECKGISLEKKLLPEQDIEYERYLQHNNDIENKGYQSFVSPVVSAVLKDFCPENKGLDFGAGTGPVISKLLRDRNYQIELFDPFFHNNPELLSEKYNYIVCCEVIEHFHNPGKEFRLLKDLLVQNGKLYCMTNVFEKNIDFGKWSYKNDLTHVFIYQRETFYWIKERFEFDNIMINERLITFTG
jgi:SAM-dependent methyltransferase